MNEDVQLITRAICSNCAKGKEVQKDETYGWVHKGFWNILSICRASNIHEEHT